MFVDGFNPSLDRVAKTLLIFLINNICIHWLHTGFGTDENIYLKLKNFQKNGHLISMHGPVFLATYQRNC